jgi:hypothetical protein
LLSEIRDNWRNIRKLVVESEVHRPVPNQRGVLGTLLSFFGANIDNRRMNEERAKYRLAMDWQPWSPEDVDHIIDSWEHREAGDNYSVGVQFKGSTKIHWFGRTDGKGTVGVSDALSQQALWKSEELRNAWAEAYPTVAALLSPDETQRDIS